jgi:hypothetical protein
MFSRVRISGGGGEAMVSVPPWNKSFLTHPHLIGVLLRCRPRASGYVVLFVNSLFRSLFDGSALSSGDGGLLCQGYRAALWNKCGCVLLESVVVSEDLKSEKL